MTWSDPERIEALFTTILAGEERLNGPVPDAAVIQVTATHAIRLGTMAIERALAQHRIPSGAFEAIVLDVLREELQRITTALDARQEPRHVF